MPTLSEKRLLKTLYPYNSIPRTKPVVTPSAQSTKLFQTRPFDLTALSTLVTSILRSQTLPVFQLAVIELLFLYGLRISEALNIDVSCVSANGAIKVKGKKGSETRIVQPVLFREFWLISGRHLLPLINVYSRHYFYKQFKRLGLYVVHAGNVNNSVTHSFRHMILSDLYSSFNDTSSSQKFIGHKSQKSTQHYEQKNKL